MSNGSVVEDAREDGPDALYELVSRTVTDDGPPECTLWPADAPTGELTTAWITARGAAFVSLEEMR